MTAPSVLRHFETAHKKRDRGIAPIHLSALDPAFRFGRSLFPSRVFDPDEVKLVLKDGRQSSKIGKFVTKENPTWPETMKR